MTSDTPPMKSIVRAFEVVHALWELRGAGPSEIARRLDLSKSTAHVYLRSLQSTGYVVNQDGVYHLSYEFLTMGSRLKFRSRLFQISKDEMWLLAEETGEMVALFVEERGYAVLLHQEFGDQSLELGTYPGLNLPLHSHAAGKILLTSMDSAHIDEIIERRGLEQVTENTITDREALRAELDEVADAGYAFDWDQQVNGMGVIAAPIAVDGDVKAALAVACPTGRLQDDAYRDEVKQKLKGTVDTLSIKHQYGS